MDRVGAVVARGFLPGFTGRRTLGNSSSGGNVLAPAVLGLLALLVAGLATTGLVVEPAQAAPTRSRFAPEALSMTIDTLTPSVIPTSGPIQVTGSITNDSEDTWDNIGLYPLTSFSPLTTSAELSAAARTDPAEPVGNRITDLGPLDIIETLPPGATASYALRVPRKALEISGESGVYWFGVQALGEVGGVREEAAVADGRARTFVPYIKEQTRGAVRAGGVSGTAVANGEVLTSLVLPVRRASSRQPDGRIDEVDAWVESLGPDGRLRRVLEFGAAAGTRPLTWLVDPAVPDAAAHLASGNLPFDLSSNQPSGGTQGNEDPTESPTADASVSPNASEPGRTDDPDTEPVPNAPKPPKPGATETQSSVAATWLEQLTTTLQRSGTGQVLSLPYGDLDVAASAVLAPDLLTAARDRASAAMERLEISARPAIAPPGGSLPPATYPALELGESVLITPRSFVDDAPDRADVDGRILTTAPYAASGPGPNDPDSTMALRQMILSEAALRLLSDDTAKHSLVVQFPPLWDGPQSASDSAAFFAGLDGIDWFQLAPISVGATQPPQTIKAGDLAYPARQVRRELPAETLEASRELIASGKSLQTTLSRNDIVSVSVTDAALTSVSYADRTAPRTARVVAQRNRGWIQRQLGKITITAPPSLTLSGSSGPLPATVSNGLDYPVTVRIIGQTSGSGDSSVTVTGANRLRLAPGERVGVKLQVSATTPGVSNVKLLVTDVDDVPLGGSASLPLRSAEVGSIVWVIIGAGVSLLVAAIGIRLIRRLRGGPVNDS